MLTWTAEEKALKNIQKIIARVWRMNHAQLSTFCNKLQKNSHELLPGQLGSVFLKVLQQTAQKEQISAKVWTELMRDTERLLNLVQMQCRQEEQACRLLLYRLEAQQDRIFQTELGRAFLPLLKEKLGMIPPSRTQTASIQERASKHEHRQNTSGLHTELHQELEKVADWLMNGPEQATGKKTKKNRNNRSICRSAAKRSPALIFACLSICFMGIWLYGQIERNQNQWQLQQMKVASSKEPDLFWSDSPTADTDAAARRKARSNIAPGTASNETGVAENDPQTTDKTSAAKNIRQIKRNAAARQKKLPQYEQMSKEYPDLFGWLLIPDTQIDLPVMQPHKESDFYLHHDFQGTASSEGALFVDAKNNLLPPDCNTVVYGHNMKNGHMFGTLDLYQDVDYFQAHKEIHFDTIYETGIYEAVAVVKTRILQEEEPGFRYYQFFQSNDRQSFHACQEFVKQNQLFDSGSFLQYGDRILMLSTCEYSQENGRLVVVARKIG